MTIESTIIDRMGNGVASDEGLSALGIAGGLSPPWVLPAWLHELGMSSPAASSSGLRDELRPKIELPLRDGLRTHEADVVD